jgi:hypothetical protein
MRFDVFQGFDIRVLRVYFGDAFAIRCPNANHRKTSPLETPNDDNTVLVLKNHLKKVSAIRRRLNVNHGSPSFTCQFCNSTLVCILSHTIVVARSRGTSVCLYVIVQLRPASISLFSIIVEQAHLSSHELPRTECHSRSDLKRVPRWSCSSVNPPVSPVALATSLTNSVWSN